MVVLDAVRHVKHQLFVVSKAGRRVVTNVWWSWETRRYAGYSDRHIYGFESAQYRRSFVVRPAPQTQGHRRVERRVFALWTGDNDLTPNRVRNLERMRVTLGVPVVLVSPENLSQWVVPEHPLHEAYQYLSLVHRSDYLRAYLMHHHGGGYSDIKAPTASWDGAFDIFDDPAIWLAGYPETRAQDPVRLPGRLGLDIRRNYAQLAANGAFIVRPHTGLTAEWLREAERRLDYYLPQLREFSGGVRGESVGYPISWTRMLGGILQPLELKYLPHIVCDKRFRPELADYR